MQISLVCFIFGILKTILEYKGSFVFILSATICTILVVVLLRLIAEHVLVMDTNHSATSFIPKNVLGKLMLMSNQRLRRPSWKRWYPSCVQPSALSAQVNDELWWEMARLAILAAGEELYILDVAILMKYTSIFNSQFCDGKMHKRLCRACWMRKSWQELCAAARPWWKRLWNYRRLKPKPDIFHFLVIGGHFMQVNSDYGLKTSGRYR